MKEYVGMEAIGTEEIREVCLSEVRRLEQAGVGWLEVQPMGLPIDLGGTGAIDSDGPYQVVTKKPVDVMDLGEFQGLVPFIAVRNTKEGLEVIEDDGTPHRSKDFTAFQALVTRLMDKIKDPKYVARLYLRINARFVNKKRSLRPLSRGSWGARLS